MTTPISIRMPEELLNDLKAIANNNGVKYQALIKVATAQYVKTIKKKGGCIENKTIHRAKRSPKR